MFVVEIWPQKGSKEFAALLLFSQCQVRCQRQTLSPLEPDRISLKLDARHAEQKQPQVIQKMYPLVILLSRHRDGLSP
jgi:hypothetical protein